MASFYQPGRTHLGSAFQLRVNAHGPRCSKAASEISFAQPEPCGSLYSAQNTMWSDRRNSGLQKWIHLHQCLHGGFSAPGLLYTHNIHLCVEMISLPQEVISSAKTHEQFYRTSNHLLQLSRGRGILYPSENTDRQVILSTMFCFTSDQKTQYFLLNGQAILRDIIDLKMCSCAPHAAMTGEVRVAQGGILVLVFFFQPLYRYR